MKKNVLYVGVDVDDNAYNASIYNPLTDETEHFKCRPTAEGLVRSLKKKSLETNLVKICYEASYLGYSLQRKLKDFGYTCEITAPSLIPRQPGFKQKTDKIDSMKLAKYYAKGLLTFIYIPNEEDESVRDLLRSRQFLVDQQKKVKNHISSLCRRLGFHFQQETGQKKLWTDAHMLWLRKKLKEIKQNSTVINLKVLLKQLNENLENIDLMNTEIEHIAQVPKYEKKVKALNAFKGVGNITALALISELGDIKRFEHPNKITSYAGLDIVEYSSGGKESKYNISKHGSPFLRKAAVDAAKYYIGSVNVSKTKRDLRASLPPDVVEIVNKCGTRLHKKGTRMIFAGKPKKKVQVACAREFLGFVWAVLNKAA